MKYADLKVGTRVKLYGDIWNIFSVDKVYAILKNQRTSKFKKVAIRRLQKPRRR